MSLFCFYALLLLLLQPTMQDDFTNREKMVQQFAPTLFFDKNEQNFPNSMEWLVERSGLYQDGSTDAIIPSGNLTVQDLGKHTDTDFYLMLDGKNLEQSYRGQKPQHNQVHVPCYLNYQVVDPESAVLQFFFLYPFNNITPALYVLKQALLQGDLVLNIPDKVFDTKKFIEKKTKAKHEGDVEEVEVYLKKTKKGTVVIQQMYFSRHGDEGTYVHAKNLVFNGTHPLVFVAKGGHASYAEKVPLVNLLGDSADGKGAVWRCHEHTQFLDQQLWQNFKGKLGKSNRFPDFKGSPRAPEGRSWFDYANSSITKRSTAEIPFIERDITMFVKQKDLLALLNK
jgi:hypothetical protein